MANNYQQVLSFLSGIEQAETRRPTIEANMITYLDGLEEKAHTLEELKSTKNIFNREYNSSSGEIKDLISQKIESLGYKIENITRLEGLSKEVNDISNNWQNLSYNGLLKITDSSGVLQEKKIGDLKIEDILKLQTDYKDMYNTVEWASKNAPKSHQHYITNQLQKKIDGISDSYDAAMIDIASTGTVMSDDWQVLQLIAAGVLPKMALENMRETKINDASAKIKQLQPQIAQASSYIAGLNIPRIPDGDGGFNSQFDMQSDNLFDADLAVNEALMAELIGTLSTDATSGRRLDDVYYEFISNIQSIPKQNKESFKMGLKDVIEENLKGLRSQFLLQQRIMDTFQYKDEPYAAAIQTLSPSSQIESQLLAPNSEGVEYDKIKNDVYTSHDGQKIWFNPENKETLILNENSNKPGYWLPKPKTIDRGAINNPTLWNIKESNDLPDLAWYLYDKRDDTTQYAANKYINDDTRNTIEARDINIGDPTTNPSKFSLHLNEMMIEIKKLEDYLVKNNATKIKGSTMGVEEEIDLGKKFTGIESIEDMAKLMGLLQKYTNILPFDGNQNKYIDSWKKLKMQSFIATNINNLSITWKEAVPIK